MAKMSGQPIEAAYVEKMNDLARFIDGLFNGAAKGADRKVGFTLLVFELGDANPGARCNYISNGNRDDIVVLMKEMIARFEGQPEQSGTA